MPTTIVFQKPDLDHPRTIVLLVTDGPALLPQAASLDAAAGGGIAEALALTRAKGKKGEVTDVLLPSGLASRRVLVIGLGKALEVDALTAEAVGAAIAGRLLTSGDTEIAVLAEGPADARIDQAAFAAHLALGFGLRSYRFDRYRTKLKDDEKPSVERLVVMTDRASDAALAFEPLRSLNDGIGFARDLASEPANVLVPVEMARRAKELERFGARVTILGETEMARLGMGALLGVGQGSEQESQLIIVEWKGGTDPNSAPLALVGKGVCFDSGGISLKPGDNMWDMKWDMGGAAAVLGAMHAIAARKAPANVVAVIAAVENMPDGNAQRPGDIVTSMSGQTIEVLNTDAEGRLILADALTYVQDHFKPRAVIDLATLTGAVIIALGGEHAGLFSNDDELADRLLKSGRAEGEGIWRLPLGEAYDKKIKSAVADMQNISNNRDAGASIGAVFIQRFVKPGTVWAHIDVAGTVWTKEDKGNFAKGATGYGVRLLDRLIADYYEA